MPKRATCGRLLPTRRKSISPLAAREGERSLVIGVCDDCPEQVRLIEDYLQSYPGGDGLWVYSETRPREFFRASLQAQPQLVLLDIDMGPESGLRIGQELKSRFPQLLLVFITAHEQYALEAFGLRAFHYLLKPLSKATLHAAIGEAIATLRQNQDPIAAKCLGVRRKGEQLRLPYSQLICFEKIGHRIRICTTGEDVFFYDNLHNLLAQLDPEEFIQCHQGYIVNINKIHSLRGNRLFLEGDKDIPVSRRHLESIRAAIEAKLFTRERR